jgi:hypothetical protein
MRVNLTRAWLTLLTTIIAFFTAFVILLYEMVRYRQYVEMPRDTQRRAEEQIRRLLEDRSRSNGGTTPTIPFVVATADGPDLKLEAGYDIALDVSQTKNPDGSGKFGTALTDYAAGGYRLENAPNASSIITVLQNSIDNFLAPRIENLEIVAEVIGCADGINVKPGASYQGDLGNVDRVPYFSYNANQASYMTLSRGSQLSNESIAFLRAYDFLLHISSFKTLQAAKPLTRVIGIQTTNLVGGKYRKVIFRMVAKNVLKSQYEELGPLGRKLLIPASTR